MLVSSCLAGICLVCIISRVDIEDFFAEVRKVFGGGDNDGINWTRVGVREWIRRREVDEARER